MLASVLFSVYQWFRLRSGFRYNIHLYADDTIIYTAASSLNQALLNLQNAFNVIQHSTEIGFKLKKDKIYYFYSYSF